MASGKSSQPRLVPGLLGPRELCFLRTCPLRGKRRVEDGQWPATAWRQPRKMVSLGDTQYGEALMSASFRGLPRIDLRPSSTGAQPSLHHGSGDASQDAVRWQEKCRRAAGLEGKAREVALRVLAEVRARGDEAVLEFTREFEGRELTADAIELSDERRREAAGRVDTNVRGALRDAADNILRFHKTQLSDSTGMKSDELDLTSRIAPLRRVAVYAPGGTAAYPSSVLMAGVPAKVAGVPEVILLTPRANDVVILAAQLAGIDRIFEVGGAQAIAAAAVGTASIPRVDKIVGPGNAFVTAAKREVFGLCDIDGIAGPSEILVVADASADPAVVAADLISQAEHDVLACPLLVTDHAPLLDAVDAALTEQLSDLPRADIAIQSLHDHGAAVLVGDRSGLVSAANDYAPEHLELLVDKPESLVPALTTAGAIFVGAFTPEAAGDYTAGPSHVLPTAGAARFGSPLGVWDFVKYTSILVLGPNELARQAQAITTLARAEGLEGHARAVERRLKR